MFTLLENRFNALSFFEEKNESLLQQFIDGHEQMIIHSLRLNPQKVNSLTHLPITNSIPWHQYGFYLQQRPYFAHDPFWHAGAYYVQEASSMIIGRILKQIKEEKSEPLRILDLSAAPGGKSTDIASVLDTNDLLISNEVINARAAILQENITKWGRANTWITNIDPVHFQRVPSYFDVIVVDAPCSGSGLWRKDTKAIEEWNPALVKLCAERQRRILADVLPALKENGILIYSTCSYSIEENENIIQWLVSSFEMEAINVAMDEDWNIQKSQTQEGNLGYRMAPWNLSGEGFFFSVLKKKNYQSEKKKINQVNKNKNNIRGVKHSLNLQSYIKIESLFFMHNDAWRFIPAGLEDDFHYLIASKIPFKKMGVEIGKVMNNELIPNHELAMSVDINLDCFKQESLDLSRSLIFLKRENFNIDTNGKGWILLNYNNVNLGFIKSLGNRFNNYYPKEWRLLK